MIDRLRKEIDKVDSEILGLIAKRMKIAKKIGAFKKKNNMKVIDLQREKKILDKISQNARKLRVDSHLSRKLFKLIMIESRKQQK